MGLFVDYSRGEAAYLWRSSHELSTPENSLTLRLLKHLSHFSIFTLNILFNINRTIKRGFHTWLIAYFLGLQMLWY